MLCPAEEDVVQILHALLLTLRGEGGGREGRGREKGKEEEGKGKTQWKKGGGKEGKEEGGGGEGGEGQREERRKGKEETR